MNYYGDVYLFDTGESGDIFFKNGQPVMDGGLETAIYISIFTGDWWGNDLVTDQNERMTNSIEPLLSRQLTNALRLDIIQSCRVSLQWLIDSNIADTIDVQAFVRRADFLIIEISVFKPNVNDPEIYKYEINWNNQLISPANERLRNAGYTPDYTTN